MTEWPREVWISALTAIPDETLKEVISRLSSNWSVRPKALPQAGLGMLKMRDTALGDPFYMGEFPLASCWVSVTTDKGEQAEGAALVMDDRVEYAEHLALCDAVLSAGLPGWEAVSALLDQGMARRREIQQERKSILARTRVDFALLDDVGEENA
jgi:alpha-D-ribose 1-methylphosphonate 5-triphosphate synthase subunit PhnG